MITPESILNALKQAQFEHATGALSHAPTDIHPAFAYGRAVGHMSGLKAAEEIVMKMIRGDREEG